MVLFFDEIYNFQSDLFTKLKNVFTKTITANL